MANSAWSGNTAGLASATSAGLVGTGAQTFAGKKTLDGGALIKGDTSGNAIASSYVGQVISSTISVDTNYLADDAWFDMTSMIVPAGTWLLTLTGFTIYNTTATTSDYFSIGISVDSGNNFSDIISPANVISISKLLGRADGTAAGTNTLANYAVYVSSSTYPSGRQYYAKGKMDYSGTVPKFRCHFFGIRVA